MYNLYMAYFISDLTIWLLEQLVEISAAYCHGGTCKVGPVPELVFL
jgi:hypothetical protein